MRISSVFFTLGLLIAASTIACVSKSQTSTEIAALQPVSGSGAVAGNVLPGTGCEGVSAQLMLFAGSNALYQTTAAPYGTFELHATPGNYVLVAQTQTGCGSQQTVTLTPGQVTRVSVTLASGGVPSGAYPPNTVYPPCMYTYYGCGAGYYPGGGGVGFGKPNLYLSGAPGTAVQVSLKYAADSNVLAAVPAHGPGGWKVRLDEDGHHLRGPGADRYDYLFYDFRTETDRLTDQRQYCVAKDGLLASLTLYLTASGFTEREVRDFAEYWAVRFPPADRYCVYPQETADVDGLAELQISPKPSRMTRVWFLIVPESPPGNAEARATRPLPRQNWARFLKFPTGVSPERALAAIRRPGPSTRAPASAGLTVHEWAVGFLFETPRRNF